MKVNMVTPWSAVCGNADYAKQLVPHLRKRVNVSIIEIKNPSSMNPFEFCRLARNASKDCDIIHVQHGYGLFGKVGFAGIYTPLFYLLACRKPILTTLHDVGEYDPYGIAGAARRLYRKMIDYHMLKRSSILHVHSNVAKGILEEKGIESSKIMIKNLAVFERPKKPRRRTKQAASNTITILGFVHRNKGHDIALRALALLPPGCRLVFAGAVKDGDYYNELKQLALELGISGRVEFRGPFSSHEIPKIMENTDILALPYRHVSQSSVMNLAISWGIPVVASDIPFFREIESRWGCILTFRNGDHKSLASRIKSTDTERKKLAVGCAAYMKNNLPQSTVTVLMKAYRKISRTPSIRPAS